MRSDLALELFAHDREDLAWIVAEASAERIAEVEGAIQREIASSGRSGRYAWIPAAIEALEGRRPLEAPPRTRSPVLEMPALLRHRAHRNDARDGVAEGLRRVRHTRAGWGWLVIDVWLPPFRGPSPFYVQISSYPGPGMRAEAVGNSHLPPGDQLDGEGEARMRNLGWEPGRAEVSDGNWVRQITSGRRLDRLQMAEFLLTTIEVGFGCGPGVQFRTKVDVWSAESLSEASGA